MIRRPWLTGALNIRDVHTSESYQLLFRNWDGMSPVLWGDKNMLIIFDLDGRCVHKLVTPFGHYYCMAMQGGESAQGVTIIKAEPINYHNPPEVVTKEVWSRLMELAQHCPQSRTFIAKHKP